MIDEIEKRLEKQIRMAKKSTWGLSGFIVEEKLIQRHKTKERDFELFEGLIDVLLTKGLKGKRYNLMINGEELKDLIKKVKGNE